MPQDGPTIAKDRRKIAQDGHKMASKYTNWIWGMWSPCSGALFIPKGEVQSIQQQTHRFVAKTCLAQQITLSSSKNA